MNRPMSGAAIFLAILGIVLLFLVSPWLGIPPILVAIAMTLTGVGVKR